MEIVTLVGTHRHETCAHGEAVQVAGDGTVHICYFPGVEVVTCREIEIPVGGRAQIARETEVLGNLAVVFHLLLVESAVAVVDGVVNRETPGESPFHIAVGRHLVLSVFVLLVIPLLVVVAAVFGIGLESVGSVFGLLVSILLVVLLALESGIVESVGERSAGARETTDTLARLPARHIHAHRVTRRIELVGVNIPSGAEAEVEILHQTQHDRSVDIAPIH